MLPHWFENISGAFINTGFAALHGSELRVLLQPNKIELHLLKTDVLAGFKTKSIKRQVIEAEDEAPVGKISTKLLTKLGDALQTSIWQKAAPVAVFSNAFVHYAVLGWNAEISGKQERNAYLQHSFLQHFGEASKRWLLCEHLAGYGQMSIASGIDQALFNQVEVVFDKANMPLKAAHPLLMLAMNRAIAYLKINKSGQSFWLACFESERLTMALIVQGEWKLVRNVPLESDADLQLRTLIQRETILQSLLENTGAALSVLLYSDGEIRSVELSSLKPMQAEPVTNAVQPASGLVQPKWAV